MGKKLITGKSLYDKMDEMHRLVFEIIDNTDGKNLSKKLSVNQVDNIYAIADGLTEKFVLDRIYGITSLEQMLKWTPEKLEKLIDNNIKELKKIKTKFKL